MATNIRHKRSAVAGKQPIVSQLQSGELAINTADGKVFLLRDDNTVQDITQRIFDNDTQILVDDKGDSSQAQIKVDINGFEKITITENEFNMKTALDMEDANAITFKELTASGNDGVKLKAPDTLPASYELQLPLVPGLGGQILAVDPNGQLFFNDADIFGGNVIYVSQEQGNDENDGQSAPVKTVKRACQLASGLVYNSDGTRNNRRVNIKVAVGDYTEDNPIIVPDNTVIKGDGLRGCIIRPANANLDMLRVRNACYFGEFTFRDGVDDNFIPLITWDYATVFDDPDDPNCSREGYINLPNTQPTIDTSPYVQNCSIISFLGGNGAKIDGAKIQSPNVPQFAIEAENPVIGAVPEQGKSMVSNAYTMLSFGGTGWRLLNDAYAQIVSCFQIFMLNGVYTQSGGYCSITNSATNFGLYALRSSGYSPKAFVFDRAYVTSSGQAEGSQTLSIVGINRDAPVEEFILRFREPGYKTAHDIIRNNIDAIADDTVTWIQAQISAATPSIWSGFTYNEEKCKRDIRLLLDAIRWDFLFQSNYRSVNAAKAYYRANSANVINNQLPQTVEAFGQAKIYLQSIIGNAGIEAEANALWDEIIDIIQNGTGAADPYVYPNPTGGTNNAFDSGFANARDQLVVNKAFIQDEVTAWIADQVAAEIAPYTDLFVYDAAACERDVGLIVDALVYDLTYGGNLETYNAALAYFVGAVAQYGAGKKDETIAAYVRLKEVISQVIVETIVTTSSGTTETQDVSGTPGSATAQTAAEDRVQEIIDYLGADGDPAPELINPDTTWVTGVRAEEFYNIDESVRINQAQRVTEYINTQIQNNLWYNFTYDIEKCRRDTKLIVDAVAKDTWDTGNRYTRNAGLAYYRQNLADSSEISISGQELQTKAAIEQAAVYTQAVITGKPGIDIDVENFVNSRFNITANAIVDPGDLPLPVEVSSEGDITNDFKLTPTESTFDAATAVNTTTGVFTLIGHGFANGTKVIYDNNGNLDVGGLEQETTYYIKIINDDEFTLTFDDSLEFDVRLFTNATNTGTHKFLSGVIEFFVDEIISSHNVYQTLILESGAESYEFIPGRSISGTTGVNNNSAVVASWEPTIRKLVVSVEEVTVGSSTLRIQFDATSIITEDHAGTPNTDISILEVSAKAGLGTATFSIAATDGSSSLSNLANLPEKQLWFHRPSIVNSSSHTWEYAGSGTDYNALPQNGGNTRTEYEQFEELPGRVYSSGTNELGDFKVGDFITAFNRTGNITFRNKVQVDELDALRLSVSDVAIEEISVDVNLGDDEIGGPSDSRLSTQLAVRSFIANRLGGFVDKSVSSAAVPGAIVQLNVNGQLNPDLIPATRQFTNTNTKGYDSKLLQVDDVPPKDLKAGDIATEEYEQIELTLSAAITAQDGDTITQPGVTDAIGYAKGAFVNSTNILVATIGEAWDENPDSSGDPWEVTAGNIFVNGVDTGENIASKGISSAIVDNYFLRSSNSSQFLVLDNDDTYVFTTEVVTNVERTSNIATITTAGDHNLEVDNNVAVRVPGNTTFDENALVLSTPTSTTFTIANEGDDVVSSAATGTAETIVTSADGNAQGKITETRYGVVTGVDSANLVGGSGYQPLGGSLTYKDVALISNTGVGTTAKANITVTAGQITDVDMTFGGIGYDVGDLLSANASDLGGTGSGFEFEVTAVEKRAYVDIVGGELFIASISSVDFVEDNQATLNAIDINLDDQISHNFLAGSDQASGVVDYTNSRINIPSHGLSDGDPILYDTLGGVAIGGLLNGNVYHARRITDNDIEVYADYALVTKITFTSTPANTNHNFTRFTVNIVDNSIIVENHGFAPADAIRIETLSDGSTSNELPSIVGDDDPIAPGSRFFIGSVTTNSFTLHALRSDALSSANGLVTNAKDLDSTGVGSARIIQNNVQVNSVVNTSSRLKVNWNTLAVTNIDAENIISGTISPSRLAAAGTANTDTFLRGDSSYQVVVQRLKKSTTIDNPITLTGSSISGEFYGSPVSIGISNATADINNPFSNLGTSRFLQTQFSVADDGSGEVFIKDGIVDAGTLDSLDSAYFLNPANLTSLVPVSRGGTNIGTYAVGDTLYAQSTGSLNTLNIGRSNTFLKSNGETPEWGTALDLAEGLDVGSAKLTSTSTALGQVYNSAVTTLELGSDADNVKIGKSSDARDISEFVDNFEATASQDVAVNLVQIEISTSEPSQNGENVLLFSETDTPGILFGMTVQGSGAIPANTTVTGVTETEIFLSENLTGNVLTATAITFTYSPLTLGIREGDEITIGLSTITNLDGTWPVSGATENASSFTIRTDANVTAANETQQGTVLKENSMLIRNTDVVFGSAVTSADPQDVRLRGESGIGVDVGGGEIKIQGGTGTGNATGGDVVITTGEVSTTSDIQHTQTERLRIDTRGKTTITGYTDFTDDTAIKLPVGTTAQRPTEAQGQIRYNTDDSTFEGYDGVAWGSLGGVKDVDQDTYITPETAPGADNDQLDFYTAATQRMQIGATGDLGFGDGLNKFTVAFATGDTNVAGNVVITGDLTVSGTTTTIDTATLAVEDKNIELGNVDTPTDTTADGGGITLKGTTDHTWNWINATDAWTSSEHINLVSAKEFKINNFSVLSSTTLGAAVINSSLQNTGALDGGSITSGFGNIDIGASNLTATGSVSLGATSFNDNNITNVGSLALDTISGDNGSSMNFASSTVVNIDNTTQSTSTTSGALIVDGGVGIAKNLQVGGVITGDGSGITNINATNLASGTVNDARLPTSQAGKTFTSDIVVHGFNVGRGGASGATNLMVGHGENLTATAGHNTGIGGTSMSGALSGDNNTALGFATLSAATSVNNNTAIGADSQEQRTSVGDNNTSVGAQTMSNSTSGDNNTAVGFQALEIVTGSNNTVVGSQSGSVLSTGNNNIIIGYNIELATNTTSNAIQIGNASNSTLDIPGVNVAVTTTSFQFSGTDGFAGVGTSLTALNASNLSSGIVPDARVASSSITQHQLDITGTGALDAGNITSNFGNINIGTSVFTGDGSGITNINANNIATGTVAGARLGGNQTMGGIKTFSNTTEATTTSNGAVRLSGGLSVAKNINFGGTATGNGSGLTALNASNIGSGTLPAARLSGTYSGLTGTGALDAGQITSNFGDIDIGTNTFSGNGSGLTNVDADTLDGIDSTGFVQVTGGVMTGTLTLNNPSVASNNAIRFGPGPAASDDAHIEYLGASNAGVLRISSADDNGTEAIEFGDYDSVNRGGAFTEWLKMNRTSITFGGNTVWHAGNDGASSGLDADTVDGIQGASLLRSDANDSFSGTLSGAGSINITGDVTANLFTGDGSGLTGISADDANTLDGIDSTGFLRSTTTANQNHYIRNASPTIYLRDTDANVSMIHQNSGIFHILRGANDSTSWAQVDGRWPLEINVTNNNMTTGGSINARTEITAYGSDERLKENVRTIDNALEKIKSLDGVFYDWKDMVEDVGFFPTRRKDEAGVLAQQVEKVLPQAVALAPFDADWDRDENGVATGSHELRSRSGENYLTVKYEKLAPLFIEAIKEQDAKIEAQAAEIAELKEMVQKLLDK